MVRLCLTGIIEVMLDMLAVMEDRVLWPDGHKIAWIVHVFGIIVWMGGLMLLTRLLAMHSRAADPARQRELGEVEKRVFGGSVLPGLLFALVGGIWGLIAYTPDSLKQGWFHAKLTIAVIFVAISFYCMYKMLDFSREQPTGPSSLLMSLHGLGGLLLLAVLFLIRFRPF